jgi:hypothetical protein
MVDSKTRALNALSDLEHELCNAIASINALRAALTRRSRPAVLVEAQRLQDDMDRLQYSESESWPELRQAFYPWDLEE